jgi:hypothetical protein
VQRLEKMVRLQAKLNVLDQPIVDHQRAKQRRFRLDILRERGGCGGLCPAVDSNYFGHGLVYAQSGCQRYENISSTTVDKL